MLHQIRQGQVREAGLKTGLTTEMDLSDMAEAWEQWKDTEDSVLGMMQGELLIHM